MTPIYKINVDGSNPAARFAKDSARLAERERGWARRVVSGQVWAKLENQNPTGTHKDRSMVRWIAYYANKGVRELAISSSGNSAISAAKYCQVSGLTLHVFVSPNIHSEKIARIKTYEKAVIYTTKTPNRDSFRFCKEHEIPNLRASKDDTALAGYRDIALELVEQLPHIDNLFIPTSSGATLEGIHQGYVRGETPHIKVPALFAVQTAKVHPIADYFDKKFTNEEESHATAIVDRVAHRRNQVVEIIKETGGGGFVISNEELEKAKEMIVGAGPPAGEAGWQSALALAGFLKWQKQNLEKSNKQTSVCLFTD